jgi:dsDNA-specific endonuclease/ATPase MutS2
MKLSELLKKLFTVRRREARDVEEDCLETFDDEGNVDRFNPFPDPVELEIGDVFDLHSIPPREVRAVVEEYLREARRKGFRQVRIIHGKGVGVQREVVRSVLARTPFVERFADAPPEAGGWGATVVFISSAERKKGAET